MSEPTKVVEAEKFVLRDSHGKVRAELAVDADDSPALSLYDKEGKPRTQLSLNADDVPSFQLYDRDGKPLISVEIEYSYRPVLRLRDRHGTIRAEIDVGSEGPSLRFYSIEGGELRLALELDESAVIFSKAMPWACNVSTARCTSISSILALPALVPLLKAASIMMAIAMVDESLKGARCHAIDGTIRQRQPALAPQPRPWLPFKPS